MTVMGADARARARIGRDARGGVPVATRRAALHGFLQPPRDAMQDQLTADVQRTPGGVDAPRLGELRLQSRDARGELGQVLVEGVQKGFGK